jgi:NADH-quinone oxidoreductase subunit M
MIFTLGALGLPGTSGFVGEFLVLIGVFQKNATVAVLASLGIILAAAYMLWLYRRIIFGRLLSAEVKKMTDIDKTELSIFVSLIILILIFGFYPDLLLNTIDVSVDNLINNYQIDLNLHLAQRGN